MSKQQKYRWKLLWTDHRFVYLEATPNTYVALRTPSAFEVGFYWAKTVVKFHFGHWTLTIAKRATLWDENFRQPCNTRVLL